MPSTRPALFLLLFALGLTGCFSSASKSGNSSGSEATTGETASDSPDSKSVTASKSGDETSDYDQLCEKYPDVPRIEIQTEVDGIPIKRMPAPVLDFEVGEAIPEDVGNEYAQKNPAKPVTGGRMTVRFSAEPKTMNPVTETSAYHTYIFEYVQDALAYQNKETLKFEPKLASKWVVEDAVRLAADYPGHVRRIRLAGGEPAAQLEIDAPQISDPKKPPEFEFETLGEDGQPLGGVWVGLYPLDLPNMPGAPANGGHFWSDADGKLEVAGLIAGKWRVNVGAELYGLTEKGEDGTVTVRAGSDDNPLAAQLKKEGQESLTLKPADYTDVQRETYFTYYLRPDATWSDGQPFTAQDLEFGYHAVRNPLVDGDSVRVYYADLVECQPLSKQVVRMKYREQYFQAFEFTYDLASITPPWHVFEQRFKEDGKTLTLEHLTEEEETAQKKISVHGEAFAKFFNSDSRYNDNPIGTGPYVIDRWNRQDFISLKRRNDYWDKDRAGYLDELVFKFIPDDTTALQALRAGELDFYYRMPAEQFFEDLEPPPTWLKDEYVKAMWYSPGYGYVGWNELKPQFTDPRVRLALALLFDREEWLKKKLHNAGVPVSGSQYIFGIGYDQAVHPIGYDPEAAKELLEAAGWVDSNGDGVLDRGGQKFSCELLIPSGSKTTEELLAVLQRNFKQVGIEAKVQSLEWASYLERIQNRDFDVCCMSWAQNLESDPFQLWHSSEADLNKRSSNHVFFRNSVADDLIAMLRVTLDAEKRECIHHSFHRLLDQEQPYMFLFTPKDKGIYRKKFRGVKWYPLRPGFDLRRWWVAKENQ
ncbi:MAG: ABC transporter substrate-binding protein [Planctomycetaceae bacterium]